MRLWHEALIPYLPRQQLLGQHRECCALRGKGWGKKHATVNYVFDHPYEWLVAYHIKIMQEMQNRGYHVDNQWYIWTYRGKLIGHMQYNSKINCGIDKYFSQAKIYPEHNDSYLQECLLNLHNKGIDIVIGR